ncbi:MAG: hypothetical protein ACWGPN_13830, partial [Gammaproteobacteria bacterium]
TAPAIPHGSEGAHPLDEFGLSPDDLVSQRYHGLDPVSGTDLDSPRSRMGVPGSQASFPNSRYHRKRRVMASMPNT